MKTLLYRGAATALLASLSAGAACADAETMNAAAVPEVVVTGERPAPELRPTAAPREVIDAGRIAETVSAINVEDALRYAPDIFVRKRHVGDVQDPITTRTSGVGSSARSLIYADGVLLSALIGNNNGAASPRWGMVAPQEVSKIEVLYGPFSAAYPGNSIGAVVNITTRMPDHLEADVGVIGAAQRFRQYGTRDSYPSASVSTLLGDRMGPLRFWLSETHTDTRGQPLSYVELTRPAGPSGAGAPVAGAFGDANKLGQPVAVAGATGLEHQSEDNARLKLSYDLPGGARIAYGVSLFHQADHAAAQSYLRDAAGQPVYAGAVNIAGYSYAIAASAFDNGVYHLDETHYAQSLELRSSDSGRFVWQAVATGYDYARDIQRNPSAALPAGGAKDAAGVISRLDGTGWATLDLQGQWRPARRRDGATLTFGAHADRFAFRNRRVSTADWVSGAETGLIGYAAGNTRTNALWAEVQTPVASAFSVTTGLRYEAWTADGGVNINTQPALNQAQPARRAHGLSPKASLDWTPAGAWSAHLRYGRAYRFPTVTELYQTVSTGPVLSVPNPDLRPERADSLDLSVERPIAIAGRTGGSLRLSLFREAVRDDLLSQAGLLGPGSGSLVNFVQNVGAVRTQGAEAVVADLPVSSAVTLSGSVTYADGRIRSDVAVPAAVGKRLPQLPRLRATLVTTWRPATDWSVTLAGRYAGRSFANIDNTDTYANTYGGFSALFVMDARVRWRITPHVTAAIGAENLLDRSYFLFHPFPGRTVFVELKYSLEGDR